MSLNLNLAYLINRYPSPSHAFIRREILALEALGHSVTRFSIRPLEKLVDPADQAEAARTTILLAQPLALLVALLRALLSPARFLAALRAALRLGRASERGRLVHLVYLAEAARLVTLCRQHKIDHLHSHFGTNPAAVALLARLLGGPPYSFTVHGPEEFDHPLALSLPEKIAHAAFVVAVSSFGRSQLYRWIPVDHWPRLHIIHCGVDDAFLAAPFTPPPEAPRLVCLGRLCEQKGQLLLVQAAAKLAEQSIPFHLTLVGDGPLRPTLETLIAQHHLQDRITITGWQSGPQIRDHLLAARLMVLPSFAEGLPVALMEALALGRPAVSTFVAGIPELITPATGWLIPAGDLDALTATLATALATPPETLAQMAQAGRALVAQNHHALTEATRLAALFSNPTKF